MDRARGRSFRLIRQAFQNDTAAKRTAPIGAGHCARGFGKPVDRSNERPWGVLSIGSLLQYRTFTGNGVNDRYWSEADMAVRTQSRTLGPPPPLSNFGHSFIEPNGPTSMAGTATNGPFPAWITECRLAPTADTFCLATPASLNGEGWPIALWQTLGT